MLGDIFLMVTSAQTRGSTRVALMAALHARVLTAETWGGQCVVQDRVDNVFFERWLWHGVRQY
ncbi:MAG: hypothetical protein C4B59_05660 [Candidatus Methanogaster sp.]|uniref:Uncharacterized protein n=1 Tax=Candidatus Methanogaster sp. TaxID=3386292 RepID=A0AC61L3I3_9EURY|nr:MAG: hypothetical protein C4B59_05660 [ANME-2 cluster archaeon]